MCDAVLVRLLVALNDGVPVTEDVLLRLPVVLDIAVPVAWVLDPVSGKEKPVDYDAVRAMHIRSIRECVSVQLQRANAGVLRTWAAGCYTPVGVGGAAAEAEAQA